jgi:hypothetical protein
MMTDGLGRHPSTDRTEAVVPNEPGDYLARIFGANLPGDIDWQLLRKAGRAAADVLSDQLKIDERTEAVVGEGGKLGWDEDGMCDDHGRFGCKTCAALSAAIPQGEQARAEAFEEAAKVAEADNTPGYGPHKRDMEALAEIQRTNIATRIRSLGSDRGGGK